MIPAASIFAPQPIQAVGARLRAARFPADETTPRRGVCVLLNGQTEFIEKYFEVIDELRRRGLDVATMDWRGQGGSGRILSDSRKSYIGDFCEYDEDLDTLMNWIVQPMLRADERPVGLAHSMGAHNLLRYLVLKPGRFAGCALCAPMIKIYFRGQREWLVRLITALEVWRGNQAGWVWGMEKRDPFLVRFATQSVTSDAKRFERTQAFLRDHPDLRLGGATWGWLAAALSSTDWLTQEGRAEGIDTPILVVGAQKDRICVTAKAEAFAKRIPRAEFFEIQGAEHEILMETDVYRDQFWSHFDDFVATLSALP